MANTWITDATHFLGSTGQPVRRPGSRGIVRHIGAIISAITEPEDGLKSEPAAPCRRRPGRAPCPGTIMADLDPRDGAIVWECPECGDRGLISNWQGTPWDRGGRPWLPDIRRVIYRSGMLTKATDTSDLVTIVLEGETLSREVVVAIHDNRLLAAGGVYGDPRVGTPIQYDELVFEHAGGKTSIRVFNRAIHLFHTNEEIYARVHRVCAKIEQQQRALRG